VVAVVGEAGVGKSRLVYEFTHSHRVQDWLILHASSLSYGKATGYLPVIDLLKGYFKIGDRDDHREMREKITGKLLALDRSLEPLLSPLSALLDVPVNDTAWQHLDPPERRERTLDAVKRLLLREAQVQPLLVVFEDLHWIDGETQALLDNLVESLGSARLLLLVNYRPEYVHHWGSKTVYSQLRLDSLPAESAEQLLAALLGPAPEIAPLMRLLVKRGNPLFLEETVRTMVETGALVGERGAYRLTRPVETLQVPASVQTILAARIDRLPREEKQLLQTAAVLGKDFPYALLAAIADQSDDNLRQGLLHLQEAEFIYETQLFPDLEYTFKHALTHEVSYGSLLQERRKTLHAQIISAIEHLYKDRLSEQVERLAHHAVRGALWEKAALYCRQAGTRALDRSASRESLTHFEQAHAALRELPESRQRIEQRIDVCFDQRNALVALGEFVRLGQVVDEGRELAESIGDQQRRGWALGYLSVRHNFLGEHARAIEAARSACAIAETVDHLGLRLAANYFLAQALWFSGALPEAADRLRTVIALGNEAPLGERFGIAGPPAVLARVYLAAVLADLGDFANALGVGEEGLRIAQTIGHPYSEMYARWGLGYSHLRRGDFAAAVRVLEPGLAVCRAAAIRFMLPFIAGSLGSAYLWVGRAAEAVPLLEEAVEAITAMQMLGLRSLFTTFLADAYLALGQDAKAREHAEQALALTRDHQQRGREAWSLKQLGDIYSRAPADAEQEDHAYQQALTLAKELGMRPLVAHCQFALAKLGRRRRKHEEARTHLTNSIALYTEMDMQFWLEQSQAEMRELA